MKLYRNIGISCFLLLIGGCSTSVEEYQGSQPEFDLKNYFSGQVVARGMVQNYADKVSRRFCVDIIGTWEGNKGTLDETFYYADGEQQKRIWSLQIAPDGTVTGGAADVVGTASGESSGIAFNWKYTLTVPVDGSTYDLAVDDWMYMLDEDHIVNRSYMSKFGVEVAQITLFFDKSETATTCTK